MTEKELFNKLVQHELSIIEAKVLIKEDCDSAKESGISKEDIALIKKAASVHAQAKFDELKAQSEAFQAKYEELTN